MKHRPVFLSRAVCVAACIAAASAAPCSRGDDDNVIDDTAALAGEQNVRQQQQKLDLEAHWDNNLAASLMRPNFQPHPGKRSDTFVTEFIRNQAARKLHRIEATCGLTPEQRQALELALEIDTTRQLEEVDGLRRKYAGRTVQLEGAEGRRELQLMQRDLATCKARLRSPSASETLFAGVLADVLDASQRQRVEAESRAHRRLVWETIVATEMSQFDDLLCLTDTQHEAVERLLLDHELPLLIDEWVPGPSNAHTFQMLVVAAFADIGRGPLQQIIDKRFWPQLDSLVNQGAGARRWAEEQALIQAGGS